MHSIFWRYRGPLLYLRKKVVAYPVQVGVWGFIFLLGRTPKKDIAEHLMTELSFLPFHLSIWLNGELTPTNKADIEKLEKWSKKRSKLRKKKCRLISPWSVKRCRDITVPLHNFLPALFPWYYSFLLSFYWLPENFQSDPTLLNLSKRFILYNWNLHASNWSVYP